MTTANGSHTFDDTANISVTFAGNADQLTFIGSTTSGVVANGTNQTVSLVNDSWMVVQNQATHDLLVSIQGTDSNITIDDLNQNISILLKGQGAYTIANNTSGPISGAFITTAHSSIFVMGASAVTLAHDVRAVG